MATQTNHKYSKVFTLLTLICIPFVVCLVLWYFLQEFQEFIYNYREQQQIFLYDADYIKDLVSPIGGCAALVGQWLVQFFVLPHVGALITTLLCIAGAVFLWLTMRKLAGRQVWPAVLAFLPVALYSICLQDSYVHYEGLLALVLGIKCLWIYSLLPEDRWIVRVGVGSLLMLALYYLAGSVAILITLSVILLDGLRKAPKTYLDIIPLALLGFTGLLAVYNGWLVDYDYAYWTKGYCEYYFEPTALHTLAWLSVPFLLLVAWVAGKWSLKVGWMQSILSLVLGVLVCAAFVRISDAVHNKAYYALLKQIHYADTEEWDKLTGVTDISPTNDVQMNYLNLGLSHQGRLLTDLFVYPQQGINSLMSSYVQYTDLGVLMSRLYYRMGVIGAAQYQAFSTTVGITYGNPSMTKLLIKTYLINGTYRIAEKQINMLEKSWYYADWARDHRKFLYNDAAVEADPELGKMRKSLPDNDGYAMLYGIMSDLETVLDANPDNKEAAEYAIALLLLSKDFDNIRAFVERYGGKGCLTQLPECLQEAIVTYSEHDPDYCREHGVSEDTIERFSRFRQEVLNLRRSGATNMTRLAAEYGKTFWYYMVKG